MRKKVAVVAVVAVVLGALFALRVPLRVRWDAHRLGATDPNERAAARAELLALGRPAIDAVWPDLIAQEVHEESSGTGAVLVIVGRREPATVPGPHARRYVIEETLAGEAMRPLDASKPLDASGPLVCPAAEKLWRDESTAELAVLARRPDGTWDVRVAVPLDAADRQAILAATRRLLAR